MVKGSPKVMKRPEGNFVNGYDVTPIGNDDIPDIRNKAVFLAWHPSPVSKKKEEFGIQVKDMMESNHQWG